MSEIQKSEYLIAKWFRDKGMITSIDYVPGQGKGYDQYGNVIKCICGRDATKFTVGLHFSAAQCEYEDKK